MKLLSIDQSTQKSGYALFDNIDLAKHGVIDVSKEKDSSLRIQLMCRELDALILRINPDIVVFEDVTLQTSPKTLVLLSRVQGYIQQSSWLRGIPIKIYYPSSWRKIVGIEQNRTIKRPELKKQAIKLVEISYGITVSEDTSEAICIGLAYLKEHNFLPDILESQFKGSCACDSAVKNRLKGATKKDVKGKKE